MINLGPKGEHVLAVNQNADTGQCGSCHFFRRTGDGEYEKDGDCNLRLPPTRVFAKTVWDGETKPLRTVQDTDGCDLWKSSGLTYIVSRRIKP